MECREILHDVVDGFVHTAALLALVILCGLILVLHIPMYVFDVSTPAEIAACLVLAQELPVWFKEVDVSCSWYLSRASLLLSVAVLQCVQARVHMPTEAFCRW